MKYETMDELPSRSSSNAKVLFRRQKQEFSKEKEEALKNYKPLPGFLVERKISQEEIEQRYEWIRTKRLKSNVKLCNKKRIARQINFSDTLCGLYCVKYSPGGETIVTGYGSGCIQLRNSENGVIRTTLKSSLDTALPITCCRFHPVEKNTLYASSACGSIFICKTDQVEFWKFAEESDNEINAIDINFSGEHIFSGGRDAGLKMYDLETGKLIKTYRRDTADVLQDNAVKYHHMRIFATKCHQQKANLVITGGWDDTLKIWDTRIGNGSIKSINGPRICGDSVDVQDTKILTGSWVVRDSLQTWDLTSGKLIETINPTNRPSSLAGEYLYSAQYFSGDPRGDHAIVGGSATGNVEIINLTEKNIVGYFSADKAINAIDSHKNSIVYGGMSTVITIAEFN